LIAIGRCDRSRSAVWHQRDVERFAQRHARQRGHQGTLSMSYRRTITSLIESSAGANSSRRLVRYRFSTPEVARDRHTIAAWKLDSFRSNPVFLWAHDASEPPIGKVIELADNKGYLDGTVEYAERDVYPFADTIFQLVRGGYINAVSTSWEPVDWKHST